MLDDLIRFFVVSRGKAPRPDLVTLSYNSRAAVGDYLSFMKPYCAAAELFDNSGGMGNDKDGACVAQKLSHLSLPEAGRVVQEGC